MKTTSLYFLYMLFCIGLSAQSKPQGNTSSIYDHAMNYYIQGDYERCLTAVQQCIDQDSTNARFHYLKGKVAEGMYKYTDAIDAQVKALHHNPGYKEAMAALAGLYSMSGQPAKSAELYGDLMKREPDVLRWKMSRALSLQAASRTREALVLLSELATEDSINWLVHKNRGDCYARIDSLHRTAQCYELALLHNPQNLTLHGQLAALYLRLDDLDRAEGQAQQAVYMDSTFVEGWRCLGIINYRKDRMKESSGNFQRSLSLGDTSFMVASHLGMIGFKVHHYALAETYLEKALSMEPDHMNTLYYLASTYRFTGKANTGIALLDALDALLANFDTIRFDADVERGHLYLAASQERKAANIFQSVVSRRPNDPINYYNVAISYDMSSDNKQAMEWYKRFLNKLDPNWEKITISEAERNAPSYKVFAIMRIEAIKIQLFYTEKNRKDKK